LVGIDGGEGVGWVGRYLWYIPSTKKMKLKPPSKKVKMETLQKG
jgi:hypothetical protein